MARLGLVAVVSTVLLSGCAEEVSLEETCATVVYVDDRGLNEAIGEWSLRYRIMCRDLAAATVNCNLLQGGDEDKITCMRENVAAAECSKEGKAAYFELIDEKVVVQRCRAAAAVVAADAVNQVLSELDLGELDDGEAGWRDGCLRDHPWDPDAAALCVRAGIGRYHAELERRAERRRQDEERAAERERQLEARRAAAEARQAEAEARRAEAERKQQELLAAARDAMGQARGGMSAEIADSFVNRCADGAADPAAARACVATLTGVYGELGEALRGVPQDEARGIQEGCIKRRQAADAALNLASVECVAGEVGWYRTAVAKYADVPRDACGTASWNWERRVECLRRAWVTDERADMVVREALNAVGATITKAYAKELMLEYCRRRMGSGSFNIRSILLPKYPGMHPLDAATEHIGRCVADETRAYDALEKIAEARMPGVVEGCVETRSRSSPPGWSSSVWCVLKQAERAGEAEIEAALRACSGRRKTVDDLVACQVESN